MVNIILSGCCGKMGRVISNCVALRDDCRIVAGVDLVADDQADFPIVTRFCDITTEADVIIDFSHPSALDGLLDYAESRSIAVVLATTGYSDAQVAKIKEYADRTPLFFSFNMSLGINLMVELVKKATCILSDGFDIEIVEAHHNQKLDAPSGTAVMLASAVQSALSEEYSLTYDRHSERKKRDTKEIGIHSIRGGTIVGEHSVIFAGHDEVFKLSHSAGSKEIFAVGALKAALFIVGKPVGLYSMSDMVL